VASFTFIAVFFKHVNDVHSTQKLAAQPCRQSQPGNFSRLVIYKVTELHLLSVFSAAKPAITCTFAGAEHHRLLDGKSQTPLLYPGCGQVRGWSQACSELEFGLSLAAS